MDNYFEENKKLLIDALLPLMPESKSYDTLVDGLLTFSHMTRMVICLEIESLLMINLLDKY